MSTTGVCLLLFFMIPLSLRNMVSVSVCSLRPLFQLTSCNFYCCFALALSTRQQPYFSDDNLFYSDDNLL